jgi:hypothetical protein
MEATTKLINQEVIDIIKNEELSKVLSSIFKKYESLIELSYDGRQEGNISEIAVFSKCFDKDDVHTLFKFSFYCDYIQYNTKKEMMVIHLDVEL